MSKFKLDSYSNSMAIQKRTERRIYTAGLRLKYWTSDTILVEFHCIEHF